MIFKIRRDKCALIGYLNDNTDLRVALPDTMADMEARN
jgi:hypothetical protein